MKATPHNLGVRYCLKTKLARKALSLCLALLMVAALVPAQLISVSAYREYAAAATGDGKNDIADATLLQMYLAEFLIKLPAEA